eukprot:COSAG06_NODE_2550_length_6687_cov_4.096843_7_plen_453_part_00
MPVYEHTASQRRVARCLSQLAPTASRGPRAYVHHLTSCTARAGRVLWEMFAWSHAGGLLLDCDSAATAAVQKRLQTFLLRADVEISDVSEEWTACALLGHARPATALPAESVAVLDPRCSALGYRAISPAGSVEPSADSASYTALRRRLGIAEGTVEITPDKFFPSELNLERLRGVSFTKGCYVGQELTARTHFTGQVRKRVLPCFLDGPRSGDEPAEKEEEDDGKAAEARRQLHVVDDEGKLVKGRKGQAGLLLSESGDGCGGSGGVALASVRLDRAIGSTSDQGALSICTTDGRCVPFVVGTDPLSSEARMLPRGRWLLPDQHPHDTHRLAVTDVWVWAWGCDSHVLPYLPSWWAAAENAASNEKDANAATQKVLAAEAAALKANRAMEEMEAEHAQALARLSAAPPGSAHAEEATAAAAAAAQAAAGDGEQGYEGEEEAPPHLAMTRDM